MGTAFWTGASPGSKDLQVRDDEPVGRCDARTNQAKGPKDSAAV